MQELIKGGFTLELAEANMHALVKALDFTIENHVIAKLEKFAMKEEIQDLDHKIDKVFLKMMISMGGMIAVACSILGFVLKF